MKRTVIAAAVLTLLLAVGCNPGVIHTNVADALSIGNEGDTVELAVAQLPEAARHVPRDPQRDLLVFEVCDRDGDCIEVEWITTTDLINRVIAGERLTAGTCVEIRGGDLRIDNGIRFLRANIVSEQPSCPADWPA